MALCCYIPGETGKTLEQQLRNMCVSFPLRWKMCLGQTEQYCTPARVVPEVKYQCEKSNNILFRNLFQSFTKVEKCATSMNSLHTELKEKTTAGFSCKIKKQCFEFYDFLHPEDVILNWSDPSLSGLIFGPGLVFLLFFCMGCKVYVHLMGTLKKPCKDPLAKVEVMDLAISGENIEALLAPDVEGLNTATAQLRGLCLVQNYFDSAKFAVVLYVTTTWITIFVLPTVYKQNQAKADEVFGKVKTQYESVNKKVAAMLSAQAATAQADTAQADTAPASLSSGRTRYALSALQTGSSWTGTDVLPPTTAAMCIKQG